MAIHKILMPKMESYNDLWPLDKEYGREKDRIHLSPYLFYISGGISRALRMILASQGVQKVLGLSRCNRVHSPCVTPEVILKASKYVDKLTNITVKEEKTHNCYSVEHLIKDFCTQRLEKDVNIFTEKVA
ncbi:hypothetical protein LguiA_033724 [Lonicera macranthoides]